MKLRIYSDLHLEFNDFLPQEDLGEDFVILAGDIDNGVAGVEWAEKAFTKPVIYVPGNHEFYTHQEHGKTISDLKGYTGPVNVFATPGCYDTPTHRIIGATLWTDYALNGIVDQAYSMAMVERALADYIVIKDFTAQKALEIFNEHLAAISIYVETSPLPVVVVTHHAPSKGSIHSKYLRSGWKELNPGFASDLDQFIINQPKIVAWIHGHVHNSFDYMIGGCRVIANPKGYGKENVGAFDPRLVIEV